MNTDLWLHDDNSEYHRAVTAVRLATTQVWPFLAAATDPEDYQTRRELVMPQLETEAVRCSAPGFHEKILKDVLASYDRDWGVLLSAREAKLQNAYRSAVKKDAGSKEAAYQGEEASHIKIANFLAQAGKGYHTQSSGRQSREVFHDEDRIGEIKPNRDRNAEEGGHHAYAYTSYNQGQGLYLGSHPDEVAAVNAVLKFHKDPGRSHQRQSTRSWQAGLNDPAGQSWTYHEGGEDERHKLDRAIVDNGGHVSSEKWAHGHIHEFSDSAKSAVEARGHHSVSGKFPGTRKGITLSEVKRLTKNSSRIPTARVSDALGSYTIDAFGHIKQAAGRGQKSWTLGEGDDSLKNMHSDDLEENTNYWKSNPDRLPQDQVDSNLRMLNDEHRRRKESSKRVAALDDIAGYSYSADQYHPDCMVNELASRGEVSPSEKGKHPEDVLDRHAKSKGIDRTDEGSYDSGDHPKVTLRDQAADNAGDEEGYNSCGHCGEQFYPNENHPPVRHNDSSREASRHTADKAPYYIEHHGDKWVVVNDDGDIKGTHDSKESARQQQKAMYVNIPDASGKAERAHGDPKPKVKGSRHEGSASDYSCHTYGCDKPAVGVAVDRPKGTSVPGGHLSAACEDHLPGLRDDVNSGRFDWVHAPKTSSVHDANKYIKQQGDKWVITQKGTGKVLSHHDSEEKANASFAAMEMNKHGAHGLNPDHAPKNDKEKDFWLRFLNYHAGLSDKNPLDDHGLDDPHRAVDLAAHARRSYDRTPKQGNYNPPADGRFRRLLKKITGAPSNNLDENCPICSRPIPKSEMDAHMQKQHPHEVRRYISMMRSSAGGGANDPSSADYVPSPPTSGNTAVPDDTTAPMQVSQAVPSGQIAPTNPDFVPTSPAPTTPMTPKLPDVTTTGNKKRADIVPDQQSEQTTNSDAGDFSQTDMPNPMGGANTGDATPDTNTDELTGQNQPTTSSLNRQIKIAEMADEILAHNVNLSDVEAIHLASEAFKRTGFGGADWLHGQNSEGENLSRCPQCGKPGLSSLTNRCHACGYDVVSPSKSVAQ